jgi:hypothetical protein
MPEDNLILGNKKGGLQEGRLLHKIYQNIKA